MITIYMSSWTSRFNQLLYSVQYFCLENNHQYYIVYMPKIPYDGIILEVLNKRCFLDYSDDTKLIVDANNYDFYFKRSLLPDKRQNNVYPLNLQINFAYKPFELLKHLPLKVIRNTTSRTEIIRSLDVYGIITNGSHRSMNIVEMMKSDINDNGGKILYMTRLWSPDRNDDSEEKERRIKQNEFRINACRVIKKHFSNSKVGIFRDDFSTKVAPDLVLSDIETKKSNYLRELSTSDICIADDGLKDTPGWKIGEYTVFKKAIISTPLRTVVTDFNNGVNYLSTNGRNGFNDLPELINYLIESKRYLEMKVNNRLWFDQYLRPDAYVQNIIKVIGMNTRSDNPN